MISADAVESDIRFHPVNIAPDNGPTLTGWCTKEGHQSVLLFTHGNGFCGRVYQPLHELLAKKYDILMLDLPGHGATPAAEFVGWNQTAEYLWQAINAAENIVANRDLHAVGHSLGGMLAMLAASKHPETFKSMVMLDPIMFPQPLLFFMHVVSKVGLTATFHPFVKPTLRRRNGWADRQEAFDYFYKRKIFKHWTDESLSSYVQHALKAEGVEIKLCCNPELEAQWFSTLPKNLWPSVKQLQGPVSILMGQDTYPFSLRAGRQAMRANTNIEFAIVPGSHCFMLEYPADTAGKVFNALEKHKASA